MKLSRAHIAALSSQLIGSDAPVNLIPDGTFRAIDGRPAGLSGWRMDAGIAASLLDRLRSRNTRLAINYEHPESNGQPLPAAGWIDRNQITYSPGIGITAPVEWTARAKGMIDAGEYAYLSPVIAYDPKTGEVRDLHLAGLTNTPALDSLVPLARLAESLGLDLPITEDSEMDLAALRQTLGLAADADESAILAKASELAAHAEKVASLTEEVATLSAKAALDLSGYVPKAVHEEALAALRQVASDSQSAELSTLIEQGMASGRIPGAATAEWLKGQGIAALKAYLADAPALAALRSTQTGGKAPPDPEEKSNEAAALSIDEIYSQRRAAIGTARR